MRSLQLLTAASFAVLALGAQAQGTQTAGAAQAADGTPPAAAATTDAKATIQAAFKRADTNSDGKLSREEAAALPAVAEKFTQLDKDSDGGITAAEFEAGVAIGQPASK